MDTAFDTAQALYDAAEPDDELTPAAPVASVLADILESIDLADLHTLIDGVYTLSDRQATVGIWIDGHEYSLTLNRED